MASDDARKVKLQARRVVQKSRSGPDAAAAVNKMYYLVTHAPVERTPEGIGEVVSIVVDPDTVFFDVEEDAEAK